MHPSIVLSTAQSTTCFIASGLIWRPIFSPPQIALATATLLALACFAYFRTWKIHPWASTLLWLMRCAVLAGLVALLMGPSDTPRPKEQSRASELKIVLDLSASMLTRDCEGQTRLDKARGVWLSETQLDKLNQQCRVRMFGFAERLYPLSMAELHGERSPVTFGNDTYLARSLMTAVSSQRNTGDSAILLLSDGHDTDDIDLQPVASMARSRGVPIHTLCIGTQSQQRDLALLTVPMQDYLLPGESGAIIVKAYQFGLPDARTVLHLRHANEDQKVPISFNGRSVVQLQLEVRQAKPGQYEYEIVLDSVTGETERKNNRQTVFCEVQDRRIKVLMLEGQPYWDTKFLAQSLRKDERIELTQITQISAENRETLVSRSRNQSTRIPSTPEQWSELDVVILGNDLQKLLDGHLGRQLSDFVLQQGGHVIFARGRPYDPSDKQGAELAHALSTIEPAAWTDEVWSDVRIELLPGAAESSWLSVGKMGADPADAIRQLPGLQAVRGVRRLKPGARRIAEAVTAQVGASRHPAIVAMSTGRGQVVALMGHDAWRWSLRPPNDESLISFYDTFWSNLIRWLVMGGDFQPGQQASLRIGRQSTQLGTDVNVEVVFKEAAAARQPWQLIWTDPEGEDREVSLRRVAGRAPRFRTTLSPDVVGVHQLQLNTPQSTPTTQQRKLNVFDVNLERLETSARPARLRQLAHATGGLALDVDSPGELLNVIERQQRAQQIPPEPRYIWDQVGIMTLLLMWVGSEWLLRRMAGML